MRFADIAVIVTNPQVSSIRDSNQIIGIERGHAELSARLDLLPDGKQKGEFKFANERQERDDEPVDLPPLPPRRVIN